MYTLLSNFYTGFCGYPQYNLAILGLEQTGKTQILRALKDESSPYMVGLKQQYKPTIGLNTKLLKRDKMSFLIWDLGGKTSFRKIWQNYYPYTHGVLFIFDSRIAEGLECLSTYVQQKESIISHPEMARIPILIFVRNSQFYSQVKQQLSQINGAETASNRKFIVQLLPHNRQRLYQHLQQIYQIIHKLDKQIKSSQKI